ncbi:SSI family serine proteinase inhibitor [Nonomuraea sp. NPDC050394]|uniref:SSI family serine proteinase inhibitor n=1 Tax=Nonomuraea sp. NPDC050394 TaxID=3364363 RepID=UPI0037B57FC5
MKTLALVVLAGAVVWGNAAPAAASQRPRATLKISVTTGDTTKAVRLTCDRDGGNHPSPRAACRLLRSVKGNPAKLKNERAICTREYMPHRVRVTGVWRGKKVAFTGRFGNGCLMKAAGRAVYTF